MTKPRSKKTVEIEQQFAEAIPYVSAFLIHRLRVPVDQAGDALQEALTRVIEGLAHGKHLDLLHRKDIGYLVNYLTKSSLHRYLDQLRRTQREVSDDIAILQAVDPMVDLENASLLREKLDMLKKHINLLNPPYDRIFRLFLDGLTLAQIARHLRISRGSIYTQFQRGIDLLRRQMKIVT